MLEEYLGSPVRMAGEEARVTEQETKRQASSDARHDVRLLRTPRYPERRASFWRHEARVASGKAVRARTLYARAYWLKRWTLTRKLAEDATQTVRLRELNGAKR